jgi:hypothetical protein
MDKLLGDLLAEAMATGITVNELLKKSKFASISIKDAQTHIIR